MTSVSAISAPTRFQDVHSLLDKAKLAFFAEFSPNAVGLFKFQPWAREGYSVQFIKTGVLADGSTLTCRFDDEYLSEKDLLSAVTFENVVPPPTPLSEGHGNFRFIASQSRRNIQETSFKRVHSTKECVEWGFDSDGDERCVKEGRILSTTAIVYVPIEGFRKDRGQSYFSCSTTIPGDRPGLDISYSQFRELMAGQVELK